VSNGCRLKTWVWKQIEFHFEFPEDLRSFFQRVGTLSARAGVLDFIEWIDKRQQEGILYEDTLQDVLPGGAEIHVFPSDGSDVFVGIGFDGRRRDIHLMALWHERDAMTIDRFIDLARQELASL
jgi:hypothetical protein